MGSTQNVRNKKQPIMLQLIKNLLLLRCDECELWSIWMTVVSALSLVIADSIFLFFFDKFDLFNYISAVLSHCMGNPLPAITSCFFITTFFSFHLKLIFLLFIFSLLWLHSLSSSQKIFTILDNLCGSFPFWHCYCFLCVSFVWHFCCWFSLFTGFQRYSTRIVEKYG